MNENPYKLRFISIIMASVEEKRAGRDRRTKEERPKEEVELEKRVHDLISRALRKTGIDVPKREYPRVVITPNKQEFYESTFNEIGIPGPKINSGEAIGEEIGHFIREKARENVLNKPWSLKDYFMNLVGKNPRRDYRDEVHTQEFFGQLGIKILKEISTPEDLLDFNMRKRTSKSEVVSRLRKLRGDIRKYKDVDNTETGEKIEQAESERKSLLEHARPYYYISRVDLSQINDFGKLFSLPDQEVRYRFFRDNPQYNLKKHLGKTNKGKGLETSVRAAGIISLVLFLIYFSLSFGLKFQTTGYSLKEILGNNLSNFSIVFIMIILLIAWFFIKKESN